MNTSRSTNCTILIIDDDLANLKLLELILQQNGYQHLVMVDDAREVLASYSKAHPDLILLDINMPNLDGFQILQQLQELNDPLLPPVIFLTAQGRKEFIYRALSEGARDFISKPFDGAELIMRVRNLLDVHLAHRFLVDQKAVLEQTVAARTKELHRTRLQVIQRLGRAAEYRDEETGTHIMRMSYMCHTLARSAGLDGESCDRILNASPMHDIGKIGIPDAILLKPGKLTPDEWEIMKTHTIIGGTLLDDSDSKLMRMAHEIALTHHEKWNGSGYPRGLKGEQIPYTGRIACLADVFDALTSDRPYKSAWPFDKAINFVLDNRGELFDPFLVDIFTSELPAIRQIMDLYSEGEGREVAAGL
ncbi:HD domain-containing phosphohydrolase [Desulfogranum marinum]|uniref:HD domain-containing phosphohydrolase n=1 Tax=Desulfogranum marinum TaxID=453220 RepID=UPI00196649D9|nr:HD domain-containing phosphohydrolase [Desulfogranum marinum]MBM9514890.1 response regulator [Desulfogranum marinum]